jgi:hypothetical protein
MFRDVLTKYPLVANNVSQRADILFPQFQLLLVLAAIERLENLSKKDSRASAAATSGLSGAEGSGPGSGFAKKLVDVRNKPLAEALSDILREIGISKVDETLSVANLSVSSPGSHSHSKTMGMGSTASADGHTIKHSSNSKAGGGDPNLFSGSVVLPSSSQPENMHASSTNHARQAMMLRMEHLFDEVETRALRLTPANSEVLQLLTAPKEDLPPESRARLPSKPVVIGDALPVPAMCPDSVEQLLEAALAHHNLGSFEDSLKFLEAARIQLVDIERRNAEADGKAHPHHHSPSAAASPTPHSPKPNAHDDEDDDEHKERNLLYLDLEMYITLCKGNVYQSCGDDEQALLHYMDGWAAAVQAKDDDWQIICVNSVGILAFYNLRYDVAILCFHAVVRFRLEVLFAPESIVTFVSHCFGNTFYNIVYRRTEKTARTLRLPLIMKRVACIVWINAGKLVCGLRSLGTAFRRP